MDWQQAPFKHLTILPTNGKAITRWHNRDEAFKHIAQEIARALEETHRLTFGVLPGPFPHLWNIPYPLNPFFTGQEALLQQLATILQTGQPTALSQPQALCGLGGIGKTQIAVEYAYRHRQNYQAIFWVRADTHETLVSGYLTLAHLLNLPEKDERDQTIILHAVEQWLATHRQWLLILDNADDLSIIPSSLRSLQGGHLLLTTRAQAVGTLAQRLEVEAMSQDVGALFLLRRAGLLGIDAPLEAASEAERVIASQITEEFAGLPLALDQAGAYMEETGCSLAHYQQLSRHHCMEVLKTRGSGATTYPASVATTWTLSFEKVKYQNALAVDLLRCCALLHPDAIPEELFMDGAMHLGVRFRRAAYDPLAFDDAVRVLLSYSLLHRDPKTSTLSIHRLVQAVLLDAMSHRQQSQWKERILHALNSVFPEGTVEQWTRCGRLLPQVRACTHWTAHEPLPLSETSYLFEKAGVYLRERAQYSEAQPLLVQALAICEQQMGAEHPDTASRLHSLAELYRLQGRYEQAERLFERALAIREQQLGAEHLDTAKSLNNLAGLYWQQGRYEQAEPLFERALAIREQQLGAEHPDTAVSLNNLAILCWQQGHSERAEALYRRALSINEQSFGAEHPRTAISLNNLAELLRQQGKYEQMEPLLLRALAIREQWLGAEHPDTAESLHGLAHLYLQQGKDEQAKPLFERALAIREQQLGAEHFDVAQSLDGLADIYHHQGKDEQAEQLRQRVLTICEQCFGSEHPWTAYPLHELADLYQCQGKDEQAEVLYQRALLIREQKLGRTHPETQQTRKDFVAFLRKRGREAEATALDTSQKL